MTADERLNRSLGQKGRWLKEELAQMAEAAMLGVDEILGLVSRNTEKHSPDSGAGSA